MKASLPLALLGLIALMKSEFYSMPPKSWNTRPREFKQIFAIDFTSSNGNPDNENSLHYTGLYKNLVSPYQKAIVSVGHILEDYDSG